MALCDKISPHIGHDPFSTWSLEDRHGEKVPDDVWNNKCISGGRHPNGVYGDGSVTYAIPFFVGIDIVRTKVVNGRHISFHDLLLR